MKSVQRWCCAAILVLLAVGCSSVAGKICFDEEKIPQLRSKVTKDIQHAVCNYNCFLTAYTLNVPVTVDKETCVLEYETRRKEVCCEGYHRSGSDCVPSCRQKCVFGECSAPETCTCYEGYRKVNDFLCEPVCDDTCAENGRCVAPGSCVCDEGFERSASAGKCVEVCDKECELGWCEENECRCHDGYALDEEGGSQCVPQCDTPCQNGTCVQPNVCQCGPGYTLSATNPFLCEPTCPNGCLNGNCTEPGVCLCNEGYLWNEARGVCEPHCKKPCENGVCSEPDQCTCNEGYLLDRKDTSKCAPKCSKPCIHGRCVAPDVCECNKGYVKMENSRNVCEAKCSNGCSNGVCVGPERCECLPGYFATTSAINSKKSICTPYCKSKCVNAYCIKPNVCQCITGYRFTENSTSVCEPICDDRLVDCTNGRCVQPNICECDEGFVLEINEGRMVCEPKPCDRTCVNGFCEGVDTCVCLEGYRPSAKYDYICEPVCEAGCTNGVCIAPNMCVCKEGFVPRVDGTCEPYCSAAVVDCSNGVCEGNNRCQCSDGYYLRRSASGVTSCTPLCGTNCANGQCVAPGVCECDEGYRLNDLLDICEPVCNPPCENGECVEPDLCQCDEGFVPEIEDLFDVNHVCIPYCDPSSVDCTNGICGAPNFCRCEEGFYSSYTNESVLTCLRLPEPEVIECPEVPPPVTEPSCNCDTSCPAVDCPVVKPPVCNHTCPAHPPCPKLTCPTTPRPATTTQPPPCRCPTNPPCPKQSCPPPIIPTCPSEQDSDTDSEERSAQVTCDSNYVDCSHGTCLGNNICECYPGYRRAIGSDELIICEPVCENGCPNGVCVAPNICECFEGYAEDEYGLCQPRCDEECVNGNCVAPNVCRCKDGYEEEWDGVCRKSCPAGCRNGVCLDGECVCDEGWILVNGAACEEIGVEKAEVRGKLQSRFSADCDEGYEFSEESESCFAVCEDCENGRCSEPNECVCDEGFVRTYIDGVGSCRKEEVLVHEVTTMEAEIAELQAAESVLIEKEEKGEYGFFKIFDRTHLLIGIVAASTALILMLATYWICTYLKKEPSFPTETIIE